MYPAFGVVLLALGGLSTIVGLRVTPVGPSADLVRGFCFVGAAAAVVVAGGVIALGLLWDPRIAEATAIIALFAVVIYYLAALAAGFRSSRPRKPTLDAAVQRDTPP